MAAGVWLNPWEKREELQQGAVKKLEKQIQETGCVWFVLWAQEGGGRQHSTSERKREDGRREYCWSQISHRHALVVLLRFFGSWTKIGRSDIKASLSQCALNASHIFMNWRQGVMWKKAGDRIFFLPCSSDFSKQWEGWSATQALQKMPSVSLLAAQKIYVLFKSNCQ